MINDSSKQKISPEFATRLSRYPSTTKIRVIVLLEGTKPELNNNSDRQNRLERKASIKAMQDSVEQSWQMVDQLIKDFDGEKLAPRPNALGSITIEITPLGIKALASSDAVKTIIENQKIYMSELRKI